MKTTELFVEQVLIGLVVLATGALMISEELVRPIVDAKLGALAVLAAGAYLVGIVYDRSADTLLQDLEQHHRLLYALRLHYTSPQGKDDPFPEDKYRAQLLHNAEASDYAHYLRSRMRLTRSLTTLVPALGTAVALNMLAAWPAKRIMGALIVAGVYALALLTKIRSRDRATAEAVGKNPTGRFALPRTNKVRDEPIREWYERSIGGYDETERRPALALARFALANEPLTWAALGLAGMAGVAALIAQQPLLALGLPLGTVALTSLVGWSWWRISETFYAFLRDFTPAEKK